MYKQRPAYPALIGAVGILVVGGLLSLAALDRYQDGLGSMDVVWFLAYTTLCLVVICVIAAFARYQFLHLWQHPDPAFAKKAAKKRKKELMGGRGAGPSASR
jgi:sterol desaturase/sphingolipid hydroxylase (fatty acid hydroxylase superfamily)